jgi:hypothetical protein
MAGATTLDHVLSGLAREGELFERLPGDRVRCYACGSRGIGKVRWSEDGLLGPNRS